MTPYRRRTFSQIRLLGIFGRTCDKLNSYDMRYGERVKEFFEKSKNQVNTDRLGSALVQCGKNCLFTHQRTAKPENFNSIPLII